MGNYLPHLNRKNRRGAPAAENWTPPLENDAERRDHIAAEREARRRLDEDRKTRAAERRERRANEALPAETPLAVRTAWDAFSRRVWPHDYREAGRTRDDILARLALGRDCDAGSLDFAITWARANYRPLTGPFWDDPRAALLLAVQGPILNLPRIELAEIIHRAGEAHAAWTEARLQFPAEAFVLTYPTTGGVLIFGVIVSADLPGLTYAPMACSRRPGRDAPVLARSGRVFNVPWNLPATYVVEGSNLVIGHAPLLVGLLAANSGAAIQAEDA
jgi:hypothetical protein